MKDFLHKRKKAKKDVARKLDVSPDDLSWINGRLCLRENNQKIHGVPSIPKPAEEPTVQAIKFSSAADDKLLLRKERYIGRRFS